MNYIFLFGHRQNCGKNLCCEILSDILSENNIKGYQSSFAKNLKLQASEKYRLEYKKMDDQSYKLSKPPHLNGKTVRDVLIHEGNTARQIWLHTWSWYCFKEILSTNAHVSFISDFRFPNEYDSFNELYDMHCEAMIQMGVGVVSKPKLIKVQVVRPSQPLNNDGADGELPDDFDFWDYNILNEEVPNFKQNLRSQLISILEKENVV